MTHTTAFAIALLAIFAATPARGIYPERPIHLIVGFPAGSQPDIVARMAGEKLGKTLRTPVVVENVTGAAGNIAAERIARAIPDGYTLGLLSQTQVAVNPSLYKLPYDPGRDLMPVTQLVVSPSVLVVNNAVPARSIGELVAFARAHPGAFTFASSGNGSGTHMAAELFKSAAGVDIRHIPYKGVVAAIPDLLGERITMMFSPLPVVWPLVQEGKLRALAVTSLKRSPAAPNVPTIAESGYQGFEATNWYGFFLPSGTPAAILHALHSETIDALKAAELRAKLTELGLQVIGNSPEDFAAAINQDAAKWATVIRQSGINRD